MARILYPYYNLLLVGIIGSIFLVPERVTSTEVTTFDEGYPQTLSCDKIKLSKDLGCICVTGLWRLYGDCSSYTSIAGESHCIHAPKLYSENGPKDVKYAMELLPSKSSIAIVRNGSKVIPLVPQKSRRMLLLNDVLVTGSVHTLKGHRGSVCVYPEPSSYCTYSPREFIGREIEQIEVGCKGELPFIAPIKCDIVREPQTCREASVLANVGEPLQSNLLFEGSQNLRKKRSSQNYPGAFGRTFLGSPAQELDNKEVDKLEEEDEDFMDADTLGNVTESSSDDVLSEIWNYIDMQSEVAMGLRPEKKGDIDYDIPFFKLLHQSKRVMQKVCPKEYVPPGFFDIATQAFIQIQVKRVMYEEPNANLPGFKRIMQALDKCKEDTEIFPFVLPTPGSNLSCSNMSGQGLYIPVFNSTIEMEVNITEAFTGMDRDPIIETVWKIVFATSNFCFRFFNTTTDPDESSFNDHHRYMVWMSSLFITGIYETWVHNNATPYAYDKFLGDMTEVISKVSLCAAASKMVETDPINEYPWEIVRPHIPGTTTPPGRRKRSQESLDPPVVTSCMPPEDSSSCFSKTKPFGSITKSNSRRKRKT